FASPSYFTAMGITLLKGRSFTENDDVKAPGVVIIDERLAQRVWPGENPVGRRLKRPGPENSWLNVIGVVRHIKHDGVDVDSEREQIYYAFLQQPKPMMSLVVRSTGTSPLSLVGAVRRQVLELDPNQPLASVQTMEQLLSASLSKPRFSMLLLSLFAAVALVLAVGGTYGVIAASTQERTREIGIRMAMGARSQDVLRMLLLESMGLGAIGVGGGLIAAFLVTRTLASQLYGVSTTDPATFLVMSLLLIAVTLAATYVPARRAIRVDPVIALKE
ncbi:MAG TPA: FtsX-like permease family protein, partial [Thermoanaerobaculia bacterium]|nr:FtsX-like permease family protein [Thermoanaerobaculia bacterium]